MTNLTFAVLVDAENVPDNEYTAMLSEVEKFGSIAIKWVYADWTSNHQNRWQKVLHETASSPKQQFHYGKDAADHALVMDAIELISKNSRINGICIVSSDGGFYSLAQRIREHGLHVMAIGNKKTPERFRKACHNFVFLDNLDAPEEITDKSDLDNLLISAYKRCSITTEPVYMGDMGAMLKSLDSSFDARTYGQTTLKRLIKDRDHLFNIVNETNDRCFITLNSKIKMIELKGNIRKWVPKQKFGFIETEDGDFYFKEQDVDNINKKSISVNSNVIFSALSLSEIEGNIDSSECPKAKNIRII
ncbi:NYN domain-containing protein [Pseudoalteromonas neustonica]|uniref:NYN domain-containing protein n=1 Tax=Pseudoalteromonas neustonica TaxID=1840331 RepID=A0ABU9U6D3_9GAMM